MSQWKNSNVELQSHLRVELHIPAEYQILFPEIKDKVNFETENISIGGLMELPPI
jgi:hypothetical protein